MQHREYELVCWGSNNTPSHFVPNINDESLVNALQKMEITFVIGEWDNFLNNNIEFSNILKSKNIAHSFYIWEKEAHKPKYWRQMVKIYL
jgi:esterase/lipase superfamily enzyme